MTIAEPNNWGRWGPADERGTMNLVTAASVCAAARLVRDGTVISLSQPISGATASRHRQRVPHLRGRPLPQVYMAVDGADYLAGARPIANFLSMADDTLIVTPHGTTTHIDALCHAWSGSTLYNDHHASTVRSTGADRCGIENLVGLVTRGVLLDIPSVLGVEHLERETRIDGTMLDRCERSHGLVVNAGDAVIIRTGWPRVFDEDPELYWSGQPGLSYDGGTWLARRDVSVVACDNGAISGLNDRGGSDEPADEDLHLLFLWRCGIHLMEMLWLEELSRAKRYEFMFVV